MYNVNNKTRYLNVVNSEDNTKGGRVKAIFNLIEPMEILYDKDVCNFNAIEIDNMYKTLNVKMPSILRNYNSVLLQYTQWCQSEALVNDGINHFEEFYGDRIYNYINKQFVEDGILSREDILALAEDMLNPMDAFALIATFEGFGGTAKEDYMFATLKSIDGNKIHLRNRTIDISDDFIKYANLSANQIIYRARSGERFDKSLDEASPLIYKNLKGKIDNHTRNKTIVDRLVKELRALGLNNTSHGDIVKSGRIHYIKTKAAEYGITPYEYHIRYPQEIANQFDKSIDYVAVMYQDLKLFLE